MTAVGFEAYWPSLVPVVASVVVGCRRALADEFSSRQISHRRVVARCRAVAVLALMRPVWQAGGAEVSVVYALDVSRSVASGFVQSALEFMRKANAQGRPAETRYVVFADRPRLVDSADDIPAIAVVSGQSASAPVIRASGNRAIDQGATNLERALDEALRASSRRRQTPGAVHRWQSDRRGRLASAASPAGRRSASVRISGHAARHDPTPGWRASRLPTSCTATNRSP